MVKVTAGLNQGWWLCGCTQRWYHQRLTVLALAAVTASQPELYNDWQRTLTGLGVQGALASPGSSCRTHHPPQDVRWWGRQELELRCPQRTWILKRQAWVAGEVHQGRFGGLQQLECFCSLRVAVTRPCPWLVPILEDVWVWEVWSSYLLTVLVMNTLRPLSILKKVVSWRSMRCPGGAQGLDAQHWPWLGHGGRAWRGDSQSTKPSTSTSARQALEPFVQLLMVAQQYSHCACGLTSGSSHAAAPASPHARPSAESIPHPGIPRQLQEAPRPARNAGARAAWAGRLCRNVCM